MIDCLNSKGFFVRKAVVGCRHISLFERRRQIYSSSTASASPAPCRAPCIIMPDRPYFINVAVWCLKNGLTASHLVHLNNQTTVPAGLLIMERVSAANFSWAIWLVLMTGTGGADSATLSHAQHSAERLPAAGSGGQLPVQRSYTYTSYPLIMMVVCCNNAASCKMDPNSAASAASRRISCSCTEFERQLFRFLYGVAS